MATATNSSPKSWKRCVLCRFYLARPNSGGSLSKVKSALLVVLKGVLMGAADMVPGVSGGTIAFITGIYERLINALKSLTPAALIMLCKQGPRVFWQHIDGTFLALLFGGVLGSIFSLAHLISHLLLTYPLQLWG